MSKIKPRITCYHYTWYCSNQLYPTIVGYGIDPRAAYNNWNRLIKHLVGGH